MTCRALHEPSHVIERPSDLNPAFVVEELLRPTRGPLRALDVSVVPRSGISVSLPYL